MAVFSCDAHPVRNRARRRASFLIAFFFLVFDRLSGGIGVAADSPTAPSSAEAPALSAGVTVDVEERFRRLEGLVNKQADQIRQLGEENRRLADLVRDRAPAPSDRRVAPAQAGSRAAPPLPNPALPRSPIADLPPAFASVSPEVRVADDVAPFYASLLDSGDEAIPGASPSNAGRSFITGLYDKGFVIVAPTDKRTTPFALKLNLTSQVRYTGFARSVQNWTDRSGQVLPVRNQSNFALNRNFVTFSGYAVSPKLRYNATVFSTSTTNATVVLGWLSYAFSKGLELNGGYYKVPGTREWLESARYPLGADRTLANTYFRPSISPGVWINGEPLDGLFYYAGIYNDFNSAPLNGVRRNTNMTYSGNVWWEPLGSFGPGYADEEFHERLAIRAGASFTYHRSRREPNLQLGQTNPENTILRLSDGTPIYQAGALGRGVTLTGANVALFSHDLSFKYRGFSLSAEYYGRWINGLDFRGGAIARPNLNLFDTGGLAQFSYALVPKRLELFARTSGVFGQFGDGSEYGGGANWYVFSTRNVRATFEAKRINHSPANNALYGYFAGASGTLFQMQLLTDF